MQLDHDGNLSRYMGILGFLMQELRCERLSERRSALARKPKKQICGPKGGEEIEKTDLEFHVKHVKRTDTQKRTQI